MRDRLSLRVLTGILEVDDRGKRGEDQDAGGRADQSQHGHLYFFAFDLFPDIFGRTAHHEASYKNRNDRVEKNSVQSCPNTSENHLARLNVEERDQSTERSEAVVHTVHRSATCVRGHGRE